MIYILSEDLQEAIIGIAYPFTKDSENNDGVEGDENLVQGSTDRQVWRPTCPRISKFCWSWSGPVPGLEIFLGPVPSWSGISKIFSVLVESNPRTRTKPLGPAPTGFGSWIPDLVESLRKLIMGKFENENDEFYKWSRSIHDEV